MTYQPNYVDIYCNPRLITKSYVINDSSKPANFVRKVYILNCYPTEFPILQNALLYIRMKGDNSGKLTFDQMNMQKVIPYTEVIE